jgi:hypothetical protein
MTKNKKFILRLSDEDLQTLTNVSELTRRSKSDVFRWALHEVARVISSHPEKLNLLKQLKLAT